MGYTPFIVMEIKSFTASAQYGHSLTRTSNKGNRKYTKVKEKLSKFDIVSGYRFRIRVAGRQGLTSIAAGHLYTRSPSADA
jgi:hypothetical protein